jgi:hypothetical protein
VLLDMTQMMADGGGTIDLNAMAAETLQSRKAFEFAR